MIINFIKTSPAQNTTVLITSSCLHEYYALVAEKAMSYDYLQAEQVGFVELPWFCGSVIGLQMAGGEFCGNAVLSTAAYVVYKGLTDAPKFTVDVSGADKPVKCKVKRLCNSSFAAKCIMPPPVHLLDLKLPFDGKVLIGGLVEFSGISHFVFEETKGFKDHIAVACMLSDLVNTDAVGVIPYSCIAGNLYKIKPFVNVKRLNSCVFERACGSGSLALGIYLNRTAGVSDEIEVRQPGGIIKVGIGSEFYISTQVNITCEGTLFI